MRTRTELTAAMQTLLDAIPDVARSDPQHAAALGGVLGALAWAAGDWGEAARMFAAMLRDLRTVGAADRN